MNSNVLIIGGAGFIGWHLAEIYRDHKRNIYLYDNLSVGWNEAFNAFEGNAIQGDILDRDLLVKTLQQNDIDLVIHLAAIHHIPTCENNPQEAFKINIQGTQTIIEACVDAGVQKLIFASSGAVYDIIDGPISEDSKVSPRDIYGISKVAGEHLMEYFVRKHSGQAIVARLFNTVGRRETNDHLMPAIIGKLKNDPTLLQLGNLEPKRDYIHVEDTAAAFYHLGNYIEGNKVGFDVFNVGSGIEYSVLEIVSMVSEILGHSVEAASLPEFCRAIDRPHQLANNTKLQEKTDWKISHSMKEAVTDMIIEAKLI